MINNRPLKAAIAYPWWSQSSTMMHELPWLFFGFVELLASLVAMNRLACRTEHHHRPPSFPIHSIVRITKEAAGAGFHTSMSEYLRVNHFRYKLAGPDVVHTYNGRQLGDSIRCMRKNPMVQHPPPLLHTIYRDTRHAFQRGHIARLFPQELRKVMKQVMCLKFPLWNQLRWKFVGVISSFANTKMTHWNKDLKPYKAYFKRMMKLLNYSESKHVNSVVASFIMFHSVDDR